MTAKPQPMAGHSEASDDLIAELAKLMAQDAHDTPPPKPAAPSPFTVRIPGEAASTAPQRREEPVRIPQAGPAPQQAPVARAVEPARPQIAPNATPANVPDPFAFAFDLGPRRETPASVQPAVVTAPVPAQPASPVAVQPSPEPADHDSIADLIAAELAMDTQPAAPAPQPVAPVIAPVVAHAPAEPQSQPQNRPAPAPAAGFKPLNIAPSLAGQERPAQPQLRPVNVQPVARTEPARSEPIRSEQDSFKVPPVFGLGTAPAAQPVQARAPEPVRVESPNTVVEPGLVRTQASPAAVAPVVLEPEVTAVKHTADDNVGLDPIDEIENLIGRAVRVDLDGERQPDPVRDRPALRSLATPQLPKRTAPAGRGVSSADEAILAAAQASGAEIGWVEAPEVDEPEPRQRREKRRFAMPSIGFSRALAGPLVAITLLLAAGFGLYWVLGLGGADTGPAPLLTADATPVKETPAAQPEPAAEQQSVVFNEMEGVVPGAEEQLVSRDQADVNEVTQVPATPDVSSEGLANRKVRTVTVRPDGTIVSADNSLAGSTILPVDRPNVPAVPGAETASPELLANANPGAPVAPAANALTGAAPAPDAAQPATDAAAIPPVAPEPVAPAVPVVTPGATVPAVDAAGNALPGKTTVIPLQRPANFAQRPVAAAQPVLPAATEPLPATTAQLPPPPTGQPSTAIPGATEVAALPNDAPAYVQLASQRTEEEARATAQRLVTRFGPLFGGANMEVQRVDLGARGIFYRVRVPASSAEQASNICVNVKAAGGDCLTM
jgi:hypothetical protein